MPTTRTFTRIRYALLAALAIGCLSAILATPKVERALLSGVRGVTPFGSVNAEGGARRTARR